LAPFIVGYSLFEPWRQGGIYDSTLLIDLLRGNSAQLAIYMVLFANGYSII